MKARKGESRKKESRNERRKGREERQRKRKQEETTEWLKYRKKINTDGRQHLWHLAVITHCTITWYGREILQEWVKRRMNTENPAGKRLLWKYRHRWDYNSKLVERYRKGSCESNSPGSEYRLVVVKPTGPLKYGKSWTAEELVACQEFLSVRQSVRL